MTVLLIAVTFLIILVSTWFIIYNKYNRYLKRYPGPLSIPLLGNALQFAKPPGFLLISHELHEKYGTIIKLTNGFQPPALQIADVKAIESILGSTKILTKSSIYTFMEPWLGTGLLTSAPTKWKKHRKILTPAFHFQILEQFADTFNLYSDILVNKLKQYEGKDEVDVYPLITLCTLDIICATSMGTSVNAQKNGESEYVRSVKEMSRIILDRILSMSGAYDFLFSLTTNYRSQGKALKVLHSYTKSVIDSRKQELANNITQSDESDSDLGLKKRNTLLDTLLKHKLSVGTITDEEIREEVDTFMFEGHDTTASALSFVIYSLANNPKVQEKSIEELHQIFENDKDRAATHKDLHEMKYLEMVIKESLRLYPSVPVFSREVVEEIELNGTKIPKGVILSVFCFSLHRDPEIYPEPDTFDPERFTQEMQAKRSPYAYIPFSAGPRNCIGQKFAMLELKAVTSKILRTFELLPAIPDHKLELQSELVLSSKTGVKVRLQKRKW